MSKRSTPKTIASDFDAIRADYDMTKHSRFVRRRTGVAPMGAGADYHFRSESSYYDAIEQARDMDRNDALVGTIADRKVDNVIQSGFSLDPKTGDRAVDEDLWARWMDFANDPEQCDIAGEMTFNEIERAVCRAETVDGDMIVIGTEDGPLQSLESHVIQTDSRKEDTFLGVTRDRYGKRTQYWVREDKGEFGGKQPAYPIDVRNEDGRRQLFHVYSPKRVLQTRGVTQIAPIFSYAGMLEDINFAKLVQQQAVSCFAIIRQQSLAGDGGLPSTDPGYGESYTEATPAGTRQMEGIAPGMEVTGTPGETISGFSPNIPNAEYFMQVKLILQVIGVNFGLPLCLILMDGSETNFSGWRGAVDEARKGFVAEQINLMTRLHKPVYEWKVSQWLEKDPALKRAAAKSDVNVFAHKWNLPTWSYIEPVADAEGDAVQLKNALTSRRRLHAARGNEWEEVSEEIVADNAYAIQRAIEKANELNMKYPSGVKINWRDLIQLPMGEGATMALQDPAIVEEQTEGAPANE